MAPRMRRAARAIAAFLVLTASLQAQSALPRQVAAPASDITSGVVRLPEPSATPSRSRAALLPVEFAWVEPGIWRFEGSLPVEDEGPLAIALASPDSGSWRVTVDASC